MMDPAQMVGRLIQQFDKDGDQKLDATELTALLASLRERGRGMGAGRGGRPGGQQAGAGGKPANAQQRGKGRRRGETDPGDSDVVGGDKPIRPGRDK